MKLLAALLLSIAVDAASMAQTYDTIPAYDVGCVSMNPWLLDSAYYYWSSDTLVIRRVVPYGSCCPNLVGLLLHSNDSILVMAIDTTSGPLCLCDCSLGYSFKIVVEGDTAYLYWDGEYTPITKLTTSTLPSMQASTEKMSIYPNPTDDVIIIDLPETIGHVLRIYDLGGRLRYQSTNRDRLLSLNDIGLGSGRYVIETSTESDVLRSVVIKR
jgi:hypothetical protein